MHEPFLYKLRGDPPALHSFPTRRSSDLRRSIVPGWDVTTVTRRRFDLGRLVLASLVAATGGGERREEDRKSTRLNSSHMSISYAVFWLKKKRRSLPDRHTAPHDAVDVCSLVLMCHRSRCTSRFYTSCAETPQRYTLSLHDALPISAARSSRGGT